MKVYVSNYLSKSISIIDYDTLTLEKEIKLDENIYPHHFCIDKEKNRMYLPSSSNGILYVLDMKNEKRIMILELGKDEDVWTDFDDVLEYFAEEDGLKISIKVEKNGFNE